MERGASTPSQISIASPAWDSTSGLETTGQVCPGYRELVLTQSVDCRRIEVATTSVLHQTPRTRALPTPQVPIARLERWGVYFCAVPLKVHQVASEVTFAIAST
jgi:hypothetical protein